MSLGGAGKGIDPGYIWKICFVLNLQIELLYHDTGRVLP